MQAYGNKQLKEGAGKGLSVQLIVKVAQVVDTKDLEKPYAQHGNPDGAGQRTLELQSDR